MNIDLADLANHLVIGDIVELYARRLYITSQASLLANNEPVTRETLLGEAVKWHNQVMGGEFEDELTVAAATCIDDYL